MKNVYSIDSPVIFESESLADSSNPDSAEFSVHHCIVLDTNAWLYVLYPEMRIGKPGTEKYADFFKKAIKFGASILLDIVIYQELLNYVVKKSYKNYCSTPGNSHLSFKNYWKTNHFEHSISSLSNLLHRIVFPNVTCVSPYTVESFDRLLQSNYKMNTNDAHITKFCKDNHCLLVTHDTDFIGEDIDIATANQKFFTG